MSEPSTPPQGQGRAIARRDFEAIIRRAAELTLAESDAGDELTEDEVLRIAGELGLPAHHVRQALYERPTLQTPERWHERWFGPAVLSAARTVGTRPDALRTRLEEYLATSEFLQVVRRRPNELAFTPAEDAISKVARAFSRPSSRFGLAHSQRVVVGLNPLPDARTHVRVETEFSAVRDQAAQSGVVLGTMLGVLAGGGLAAIAIVTTGGPAEPVLAVGGAVAGLGTGLALAIKAEARKFRDRLARARAELEHLLDRVEAGQSLEPPPPPWRRNLQAKLFGPRR